MVTYFNQSSETTRISTKQKQYVVVIYDISDTKRRNKLVKVMKSYGGRVQLSAFEFLLKPRDYQTMLAKLDAFYEKEENDQIRVYKFRGETDVVIYGDEELAQDNELGLEFV
jgi:CRISPR-associated protein Cas2